jgi:hypothetical protein
MATHANGTTAHRTIQVTHTSTTRGHTLPQKRLSFPTGL